MRRCFREKFPPLLKFLHHASFFCTSLDVHAGREKTFPSLRETFDSNFPSFDENRRPNRNRRNRESYLTRRYRERIVDVQKKKKKNPSKTGQYVHSNRILVFSAIPPHLYPPLFDMNTFTLYFYQPTISRRWGPFTSSICTHLHDFSSWRGYIVARAIVSRDNTRRGSPPIDRWNDRSYYCTQKSRNNILKSNST